VGVDPAPKLIDPGSAGDDVETAEFSFLNVCARLAGPDFNIPVHLIPHYDPWKVQNILFHPRDKYGNLIVGVRDEEPKKSARDLFFERYRDMGYPDDKIESLFKKDQELKAALLRRRKRGGQASQGKDKPGRDE
jgi:hypothetical protein